MKKNDISILEPLPPDKKKFIQFGINHIGNKILKMLFQRSMKSIIPVLASNWYISSRQLSKEFSVKFIFEKN